ncbi:MAG: hypothetical protein WCK55_03535 [Verrucomicrobiota bacterium]
MPHKAKPQPEKKKRGRPAKHALLWQLAEEQKFEREHWWMISRTQQNGTTKMELNKEHPELTPTYDDKSRSIIRLAPIVWELLRRHGDLVQIRNALKEFLPGEGSDGKSINGVFREFGFELEYMLAASGLNAWQSGQLPPRDYRNLKKGAIPLNDYSRFRFEQLMDAYRHRGRADKPDNWWMDLTQFAHSAAASVRRMDKSKPRKADKNDPFSVFTNDVAELEMLKAWIASARQSGQRLAVIAHTQTGVWYPSEESPRFDENDNLRFLPGHISDPLELLRKLKEKEDPVSAYLWGRLTDHTQNKIQLFDDIDGAPYDQIEGLLRTLCYDLNEVLSGPRIYDATFFKSVVLPANTKKLLSRMLRGEDLVRLNRLLLEAAYDKEIVKSSTLGQSAAERETADRRPNPEQLTWIYEVENGGNKNRSDYNRMLKNVGFPLLPCGADPKREDPLTARLKRVCAGLREIPMRPDIVK